MSENVIMEKNTQSIDMELSIMNHLSDLINQADQKAQFTLTVSAVLLASTTVLGTGQSVDIISKIVSLSMVVTLAISIFFSLLVVIPRLPAGNLPKNIFYFGSIVQTSEKIFIEEYDKSLENIVPMLLSEIYVLALIEKKKLKFVRLSYIFLGVSVAIWIVGQAFSFVLRG